jgi:hypothetical protein
MFELRLGTRLRTASSTLGVMLAALLVLSAGAAVATAQQAGVAPTGDFEEITSADCASCHEGSLHGSTFVDDLSHSIHDGLECLDCHQDRGTVPHREMRGFFVGCQGCRTCHEDASEQYTMHGRGRLGEDAGIPMCSDCHGDHDILPSSVKRSKTHPVELPHTCGACHENIDLTTQYDILIDHPIEIYQTSVHGQATRGGVYVAATCNDCHSAGGTAHKILAPGDPNSSINHFNIP